MTDCHHLYATDYRWWKHHAARLKDYKGQRWSVDVAWKDDPESMGVKALRADTSAAGLSIDDNKLHTGRNSGYAAINLARHLLGAGGGRILLLGYDMKMHGDKRHWFGAHPEGMEVASNYASFIEQFKTIQPQQYGLDIWNVTRDTALSCFPIYDLDEIVKHTAQV